MPLLTQRGSAQVLCIRMGEKAVAAQGQGPRANPGAPGVRYGQLLSGAGKVGTVVGIPFRVPLAGGEAGPLGS